MTTSAKRWIFWLNRNDGPNAFSLPVTSGIFGTSAGTYPRDERGWNAH